MCFIEHHASVFNTEVVALTLTTLTTTLKNISWWDSLKSSYTLWLNYYFKHQEFFLIINLKPAQIIAIDEDTVKYVKRNLGHVGHRWRSVYVFILWMTEELICPLQGTLKRALKSCYSYMIPLVHTKTRCIYQEHNTGSSQCILVSGRFNLLFLFSVYLEFL